jgi:hypothetical protein
MTEHYRRRDFGHIDLQIELEDPKAYTKPWTVAVRMDLEADTELLETVCENEKDRGHMSAGATGSEVKVPPETLGRYAGTYEVRMGIKL